MIFLPRGKPIKEKINPARVNLPAALEKLRGGSFTGYLRFDAARGNGVLIFDTGRLVSAFYQVQENGKRLIAYDAIVRIFADAIQGLAELNIYRVDSDLAKSIHSVLNGDYVYQGQELRQVQIGALLDGIKRTGLSGCLRVYAERRTVLIFYEKGSPLGFFHDGSTRLEQDADLSLSVARLPGARLDLLATRAVDGAMLADLMASADLDEMWRKLRKRALEGWR